MFTKISVLVPTRKRLPQLQTMLESYAATVLDPTSAELLFRIDDDDPETEALLQRAEQGCLRDLPWSLVTGPRYEGYRSFPWFVDELRQLARGDVFMVGNDDMVFRTPDWPRLLLEEAGKYPDGLFDLGVQTYNAGVFPWSVISRHAVDLMGHIHDPRLFWGDVYLRDVMACFGRAIAVPHVQIDHVWMGHTPDQTFLEARQGEARNWDAAYWALHRQCVDEAFAKLDADHRVGPAEAPCLAVR